jgi:hypothetical protein
MCVCGIGAGAIGVGMLERTEGKDRGDWERGIFCWQQGNFRSKLLPQRYPKMHHIGFKSACIAYMITNIVLQINLHDMKLQKYKQRYDINPK